MPYSITNDFITLTSAPCDAVGITEFPPCLPLREYVRCFWTYTPAASDSSVRIIPDCCCDVIIPLNGASGWFCGLTDRCFINDGNTEIFGIRFYAWAISMFTDADIKSLFNGGLPAEDMFFGFGPFWRDIVYAHNTAERVEIAQRYLLGIFRGERINSDVMNSLFCVISNRGRTSVSDLGMYCASSNRTLERVFLSCLGTTPKSFIGLLRYQMLWQDVVKQGFDALDCVEKFGYFDQAHMYNDFKKYHGIGLGEARREFLAMAGLRV